MYNRKMYAIGTSKNEGKAFAMWHGPNPSEEEMLKENGSGPKDYLIRFNSPDEIESHQFLWKWNDIQSKWVRHNPKVLNKRTDQLIIDKKKEDCVYIGRGSKWGNPFKIGEHGTREQVVTRYMQYLAERPNLLEAIPELENKFLVCFCAPQECHGDVLIDLANPIDNGEPDKWEFHKYLPDKEDFEVKGRECGKYIDLIRKTPCDETDHDIFCAGFTRGLAWGIYKTTRSFDHLTRAQADRYIGKNKIDPDDIEDDIPF